MGREQDLRLNIPYFLSAKHEPQLSITEFLEASVGPLHRSAQQLELSEELLGLTQTGPYDF